MSLPRAPRVIPRDDTPISEAAANRLSWLQLVALFGPVGYLVYKRFQKEKSIELDSTLVLLGISTLTIAYTSSRQCAPIRPTLNP